MPQHDAELEDLALTLESCDYQILRRLSATRDDKTALSFIGVLCLAAAKLGYHPCQQGLVRRREMTGMAFNQGTALARRKHVDYHGHR